MSGTSTTFSAAIADIDALTGLATSLATPLGAAAIVTQDVVEGLDVIPDIADLLTSLRDMCAVVTEAIPLMSGIPGLGEILDLAEPVFDGIDGTLGTVQEAFSEAATATADVRTVFADIGKGIADIESAVTSVASTLPQYVTTIQILSYLEQVAVPVAGVMQGSDAGTRVSAVLATLDAVQKDVSAALVEASTLLTGAKTGADWLNGEIQQIFGSHADGMRNSHGLLGDAITYLQPVASAFRSAQDRIAPLRWVLKAVEWVMDHILQPVIDWIMKTLHLDELLQPLKDKLLGALPSPDAASSAASAAKQGGSGTQGSGLTSSAAGNATSAVKGLVAALEQYRQNNNQGLKDEAKALLESLVGGTVDPSKPWLLPPLPPLPQNPSVPARSVGAAVVPARNLLAANVSSAIRSATLDRISRPVAVLAKGSDTQSVRMVAARDPAPVIAPDDDLAWATGQQLPPGWKPVSDLVSKVAGIVGSLASATADVEQTQTLLIAYEQQAALPSTFQDAAEELDESFSAMSGILGIVATYADASEPLAPLVQEMAAQSGAAGALKKAAAGLPGATADFEKAVGAVNALPPLANLVSDARSRYAAWAVGAVRLAQSVVFARSTDIKNEFAKDVTSLQDGINAACASVAQHMDATVQPATTSVIQASTAVLGDLGTLGGCASTLLGHARLVTDVASPALATATHYLSTAYSVLDPLSNLLEALNCGGGKPQQFAGNAVAIVASGAKKTASGFAQATVASIDDLLASAFPLAAMATDVVSFANAASAAGPKQRAETLSGAVGALEAALANTTAYVMTGPSDPTTGQPSTISVPNPFLDTPLADAATALFANIGTTYPQTAA